VTFLGPKHILTPPTHFPGGQDPATPRIYAPGLERLIMHSTIEFRTEGERAIQTECVISECSQQRQPVYRLSRLGL